jgi:ADP-ribose pyrophosphatase YjhB (NUDIX family)
MRVKVRAVIFLDGLLVLADQLRGGKHELSLPGGRVKPHESVTDALAREVNEETGLEITTERLLYVSELVESVVVQELELVFLAETSGVPSLNGFRTVDLIDLPRPSVHPPILGEIACDAMADWRDTPRWLGNLRERRADQT